MQKLLITGGEGMLAGYLARVFASDLVLAISRRDLDTTNRAAVATKIAEVRPTLIINCAAYNNVDKAETEDRELAMKINGEAVGYLAQAAAEVGATFVTFSSEYVFDGTKKEGYTEDDRPNPVSIYGQSKALGELRVTSYGLRSWYIIRTSRLFGQKGPGASSKQSFSDKLIEMARGGKTEFDLVDAEISSPTYASDLAQAVYDLVKSEAPSGIYHRTNDGACSWFEFGSEVFRLAGISATLTPVPPEKFPRPARRPEWGILHTTKLPPLRSWQEALKDYLKPE